MRTLAALLTIAALTLTGCGGDEPQAAPKPTAEPTPSQALLYDQQDIVEYLGLTKATPAKDDGWDGWKFTTPGDDGKPVPCYIGQIFTSRMEVEMYAPQGNVAVTPEGNVGLEINGEWEKTCFEAATELLTDLEAGAQKDAPPTPGGG